MLAARQPRIVAGLDLAALAFRLIDPALEVTVERRDGSEVSAGDVIASIIGPARSLLTAERVALNFLCHLSGVATATASVVAAVREHRAHIVVGFRYEGDPLALYAALRSSQPVSHGGVVASLGGC